ncbi:myrosinase 1-like isoform X2 [Frankliniella occidentalis]|uniref:Myrosinase 1-like isoform X2 n=1 Tax=Frankliniella occidentalis TaxID=133901 RepID=A0A9C6WPJ7_FRAOC|nr:myrosinase 1-like isoform X2 [Frankliniella occidentalis]
MVRLVLFALLTAAIEVGLAHSRQVGSTLTCNGRARRCLDCKSLVRCSKRNGVYWPLRATACPPARPYCHDGHCVTSPPEEICSTTAEPKINSEFLCVANGYYPDPSSCRRYYFCVENVAYQYECVGNSVYHHQAAMCVGSGAVCSTTACTPLLVGKYQLYEQDPTVYVVCMDTNPANALVARCPRNHTMSENTVSCQPACTGPGRYAVSHGAREDFFTPNASVSDDLYIMPTNFRLGATSSAYQTEGAWDTDGKGPSIQDNFYHGSGGDSGDIACNSYAEYLVDVNLLRNMSFQTYHFSMSWSRLLPTGSSLHANQVAINFYDKLLSALIENHIEPVVTLHHWDIPSGIVNGWLNSSAPDYFLDYATFAFSLFGSRVSTWLLLHDPVTLCVQGYAEGQIGPGIVDSQGTAAYRCVHNQILAHAQAYRAYRRDFADWQQGRVGSTLFLDYGQPQNASSAADAAAAERFMEASFAWVADPLFTGRYPDSLRQAAGDKLPSFTPAQMALVTGSTDFLGLKHSSARLCTEGQRTAQISFSNDVNVATRLDEKWLRTPGGQDAITPWSIRGALNWIDERYNGVQVLVTENGYSGSADNDIDDVKRSAYFSAYLRGVMRAVNEDRCNVMGYAARSLTDSFEWNNGYNVKYGLAHVDFSSGSRPRLLKPAPASFFRNVLQNRAVDFVAFISP